MKLRSRRTLALTASVLAVAGGSAALANAQSSNGHPKQSRDAAFGTDTYLDSVAKHLGIDRSKLDSALQALVVDHIDWAAGAGFITEEQAKALKERASAQPEGRLGLPFGLGLGFRLGFGLQVGGFPFGSLGIGASGFSAAADYLGLTVSQLRAALADKTLAQVAADQGKSLDGLKQATHDAAKSDLDDARADGAITQKEADALLGRLDSTLDDLLNGRSPAVTALANKLVVDRAALVGALRAAAADQVDQAVAKGFLSQEQADALKKRIQSADDEPFGLGRGLGLGLGFGFAPPFGLGKGRSLAPLMPGGPPRLFGGPHDGVHFSRGGRAVHPGGFATI
jgi:hypothetical protein